ncbi:MAG: hypothetical protein R3F11_29595 [Verrucomicrobiales bacterium]
MRRSNFQIDGLSAEDWLRLSEADQDQLIFAGDPIVFSAGTAEVLGQFSLTRETLTVELAQIEGGGEGVLPALWGLAERFAEQRRLS